MEGLAKRQPLLIVFEDAHWADATSLEVLDLAIERVQRLPILFLITYRPEFEAPWKGLPDVATIALGRLDRAEAETLVERVLSLKSVYRGLAHEDEMVALFNYRTFNLNPRATSIDTPLHGFVPHAHVDHVHADAVIAVAASENAEELMCTASHGLYSARALNRPPQ